MEEGAADSSGRLKVDSGLSASVRAQIDSKGIPARLIINACVCIMRMYHYVPTCGGMKDWIDVYMHALRTCMEVHVSCGGGRMIV